MTDPGRVTRLKKPTIDHYEFAGMLWCTYEKSRFPWETGEVTCPHCGREFSVPEANE